MGRLKAVVTAAYRTLNAVFPHLPALQPHPTQRPQIIELKLGAWRLISGCGCRCAASLKSVVPLPLLAFLPKQVAFVIWGLQFSTCGLFDTKVPSVIALRQHVDIMLRT